MPERVRNRTVAQGRYATPGAAPRAYSPRWLLHRLQIWLTLRTLVRRGLLERHCDAHGRWRYRRTALGNLVREELLRG